MSEEYNKLKNDIYVYTSLEEAREEILQRRNDIDLRKKIEEYIGEIPEVFHSEPRSILFRNIVTPDHELLNFIDLSEQIGMKPVGLEYTHDKFSTRNSDKLCLAKMAIFEKRSKNGDPIMHYKSIIDVKANDNRAFEDIKTTDGKILADFHHELLRKKSNIELHDMSPWIAKNGGRASIYYKKIFALAILHGVLFEYFVTNDSEAEFENNVTLPAFIHIWETFKIKPLVVKLIPDHNDKFWWCFPANVLE